MATQQEFRSLTEEIQYVSENMGDAARPDDVYSAAEQMETAISDGFERLGDAVSNVGGSLQPATNVENIEQQVESVVSQEVGVESFEAIANVMGEVSESEETSGSAENIVNSLKEQLQGLGEEATGLNQVKEDLSVLDQTVNEFAGSANASEENISKLKSAFNEFREGVEGVSESVMEGDASLEQAQSTIAELSTQLDEEFSDLVGEEGFEGAIEMLKESSSTFVENFKEASEAAKEVQMQQQGFTGQTFIEVGGAVSEIGGGELSFIETLSDRIGRITSTITAADAGGLLPSQDKFAESESAMGAIADQAKNFAGSISAARVTLGAILTPIAIGLDLLEDVYNVARDFREETGIGAERMREIRQQTAMTSSELAEFGLDPSAFGEIAGGLREQFGSVETAIARTGAATQKELTTQVAALSKGFALSAKEAANLQANLTRIEESTGISAKRLARQTRNLAMQQDVAPQAAIQDIAENSSKVAKFSGDTGRELAQAAVEAQKLGTSIESISEFQEGVLTDISGTVEGLQKASMLTGQQLNATALIEASYEGQGAAIDELQAQLGGMNLENLNPFAKMSLEDAIPGMNFEQIQNIIEGRKELNKFSTQAEKTQAILDGKLSFEEAITAGSTDKLATLNKTFNALYFTIAEELFPPLSRLIRNILPALTGLLESIAPILEGAAMAADLLVSSISYLASSGEGAKESLDNLKSTANSLIQPFENIYGYLTGTSEQIESADEKMSMFESTLTAFGTTLAGSYLIKKGIDFGKALTNVGGAVNTITQISGTFETASLKALEFQEKASGLMTSFEEAGGAFQYYNQKGQAAGDALEESFNNISLSGIKKSTEGAMESLLSPLGKISDGFDYVKQRGKDAFESLKNAPSTISRVAGSFRSAIPSIDDATSAFMKVGKRIPTSLSGWRSATTTAVSSVLRGVGSMVSFVVPSMGTISGAFTTATSTVYGFATSLTATGIGGVLLAIAGAATAVYLAFEYVIEEFQFANELFNSFMKEAFGVENATSKVLDVFYSLGSVISDVVIGTLSKLGDMASYVASLLGLGGVASSVGNMITRFYEGKTAAEAIGSSFGFVFDLLNPLDELYTAFYRFFEMIESLFTADSFSEMGSILLEGLSGIGESLVSMIVPDRAVDYVIQKMTQLGSYIMSFLPSSPAERGPLSALGSVGEALINMIFGDGTYSYLAEKMSAFGSLIMDGFSVLGNIGEFLQLDHIGSMIGNVVGYVSNLIQKVYQSEEAMGTIRQALDPVMSVLNVMFDPVIDAISYVSELVELFYNLGAAVVQGNFENLGEILLEGVKSVGESFIDLIIPFNLEGVVKDRMSSIFGSVVPYVNETIDIISQAFSGFVSLVSDGLSVLGSVAEFFQLDHIFNAIGTAIEYMANLVTKVLQSKSAMNTAREAFNAAIQPMQTALSYLIDPFVDLAGHVMELTELFYDLGAAVVQGNFSDIGGILLEGIGDLGTSMLEVLFPPGIEGMVIEKVTSLASYLRDGIGNLIDSISNVGRNLIRSIVPDSALRFIGEKMDAVASTIRSYLPFSPAEEGPLAELDMVGEALIDTIFGNDVFEFVSEKISQLTSVISDGIMDLGEGILNFFGIGGEEEQAQPTPEAAEASKFSIQNATISVSSAEINLANAAQEASSRLTTVSNEEITNTRSTSFEQNTFSDSLASSEEQLTNQRQFIEKSPSKLTNVAVKENVRNVSSEQNKTIGSSEVNERNIQSAVENLSPNITTENLITNEPTNVASTSENIVSEQVSYQNVQRQEALQANEIQKSVVNPTELTEISSTIESIQSSGGTVGNQLQNKNVNLREITDESTSEKLFEDQVQNLQVNKVQSETISVVGSDDLTEVSSLVARNEETYQGVQIENRDVKRLLGFGIEANREQAAPTIQNAGTQTGSVDVSNRSVIKEVFNQIVNGGEEQINQTDSISSVQRFQANELQTNTVSVANPYEITETSSLINNVIESTRPRISEISNETAFSDISEEQNSTNSVQKLQANQLQTNTVSVVNPNELTEISSSLTAVESSQPNISEISNEAGFSETSNETIFSEASEQQIIRMSQPQTFASERVVNNQPQQTFAQFPAENMNFAPEQVEGDTVETQSPEIQPQSPDVAAPDTEIVNSPRQVQQQTQQTTTTEQTDEIRLDSSSDDIESILRNILRTQKNFLKELRNGNIAVYLDGRKVNKEMLRSTEYGT